MSAIKVWKVPKRKLKPLKVVLTLDDDDIPSSTDEEEHEISASSENTRSNSRPSKYGRLWEEAGRARSGSGSQLQSQPETITYKGVVHQIIDSPDLDHAMGRTLSFGPSSFTQDQPLSSTPLRTLTARSESGFSTTWTVTALEGSVSRLEDNTQNDVTYTVPTCNVYKAQDLLDRSTIACALLQQEWCRKDRPCRCQCHEAVTINDILKVRYEKLQHPGHEAQRMYMASLVERSESINGRRQLVINDTPVCCNFWMKALATSTNTYQSVLKTVGSGCKIPGHHGNKGRLRTTMQNIICTAFWRDYFATYCQTSDNELYFWPVGSQMTWVHIQKEIPNFL